MSAATETPTLPRQLWLAATTVATFSLFQPAQPAGLAMLALLSMLVFARRELGAIIRPLAPVLFAVVIATLLSATVAAAPSRVGKVGYDVLRGLMLAVPLAAAISLYPALFPRVLAAAGSILLRFVCALLCLLCLVPESAATAQAFLGGKYALCPLLALAVTLAVLRSPGDRRSPVFTTSLVALDLLLALTLAWLLVGSGATRVDPLLIENTLGNRNTIGSLLTLPLLLLLTRLLLEGLPPRASAVSAVLLAGVALLFLQSRGALLALVIVTPVLLALRWPRLALRAFIAAMLLILLAISALLLAQQAGMDLSAFSHNRSLDNGRMPIYLSLLNGIAERPLLGWGMGSFKNSPFAQLSGFAAPHPHNIYLELLFSVGIIGSLLLLAGLAASLRRLHAGSVAADGHALRVAGTCLLLWFAVRGVFDLTVFSYANIAQVGVALGLLAAAQLTVPGRLPRT